MPQNSHSSNALGQQFLALCRQGDIQKLRELQKSLPQMPTVFQAALFIAAEQGFLGLFNELTTNHFYRFQLQPETVLNALIVSLKVGHTHIAQHVLEHSILTRGNEQTNAQWGRRLFFEMCVKPNEQPDKTLGFLVDYLEAMLTPELRLVDYTIPYEHQGFKMAWSNNQAAQAEFLIRRFQLTGEEPVIQRFLAASATDMQEENRSTLLAQLLANKEKNLLQQQIHTVNKSNTLDDKNRFKI